MSIWSLSPPGYSLKKKEKDLPYCLFFAIPFNEKSFVLLKKKKKQETTD